MGILEAVVGISSTGLIATTRDISAYRAFSALVNGMDFAGGHALAWSCLFVGCAILKTRAFSCVLGWLFLLTGIFWIPRFMVPQLGVIPALMSCVAAIWIGISLLRQTQSQPVAKEVAASR